MFLLFNIKQILIFLFNLKLYKIICSFGVQFKRIKLNYKMTDFGIKEALKKLGLKDINEGTSTGSNNFSNGEIIESCSPVDGKLIGKVIATSKEDYEKVMTTATKAYQSFRDIPAPQRGEIVRQFGNKLRVLKEPLGKLLLLTSYI